LGDLTFRSALASRSRRSSASAGDGMDGESAGASTVESSSAAILGPTAAERFIITQRLSTEIIEDSRVADSERAGLRIAVRTGSAQPGVTDMRAHLEATRAHLEATRARPTASPAAIAAQPRTGALQGTEPTQAIGDSRAVIELSPDADQAHRGQVVSAAAAAVEVTVAADTAASANYPV
jgi:hypothetical protein